MFDAVAEAIAAIVPTRAGSRKLSRRQFFTANGGAFNYEALPYALDGGLVEGGTPECHDPGQLLLYQRAQDALLVAARPHAEELLAQQGFAGTLGFLKNCRDAEGHIYGAQENYEVEVADGARLVAYRAALALLIPLVALSIVSTWVVGAVLLVVGLGFAVALGLIAGLVPPVQRWLVSIEGWAMRVVSRGLFVVEVALWWPVLTPFGLLLRALAFRPVRRGAEAFLVSRPVLTGAGTLLADGTLALSEKGTAIVRTMRLTPMPVDRAIVDTGNLMKLVSEPMTLRLSSFAQLFRRRQRLQLGLSDSNVAQVAEYLKVATTTLVIDMAEAGALGDAPRLADPVAALRALNVDPDLKVAVPLADGRELTALELQRWYLERAREFVRSAPATSIQAAEAVALWEAALDDLAAGRAEAQLGRLDWVTKRTLLVRAGAGAGFAERKKIDLRYHELGDGYLRRLEEAGLAPALVTPQEVEEAIQRPPEGTPAFARGHLVKRLAEEGTRALVSWGQVRVGGLGGLGGKVIRLDDYRRRRREE